MHVLVVPAWYDENDVLVGKFIEEQAEALAKNGVKVSFLVFVQTGFFSVLKGSTSSVVKSKKNGISYWKINCAKIVPSRFSFLFDKIQKNYFESKVIRSFRKNFLPNNRPDVIQIQSVCNNITPILAYRLSKKFKIPYVLTEHYSSFKEAKGALFKPYTNFEEIKKIVSEASSRMSVSATSAKIHKEYFESDFSVVSNMISEEFEKTPLPVFPKGENPFVFVCIAGLEKHKGQEILMSAFLKQFKNDMSVRLEIIGEGSSKERLIGIIEKDKIANVILLGKLNKSGIIKRLDHAHVVVSASFYETFGLTLVEGFFRANPAIATRSGGPDELIEEWNGLLCNANDENDLALKMKQIKDNYKMYEPLKIRERAISKFSEKQIISELLNYYHEAIVSK